MKKQLSFVCGLMMLLGLSSCFDPRKECESITLPSVSLGFFRNGDLTSLAVDTSFLSVFAVGTDAELRSRRFHNQFSLPVPVNGGEVRYVFKQADKSDTVALFFTTEAKFISSYCPPVFEIAELRLLPEHTSLPLHSVKIVFNQNYYEKVSVAVLVP